MPKKKRKNPSLRSEFDMYVHMMHFFAKATCQEFAYHQKRIDDLEEKIEGKKRKNDNG